jgi:hypothetical protein
MLRLPIEALEIEAGCNFTIADSLFGVIEGVSAVLWPRDSDPAKGFVRCVRKYYPKEIEGSAATLDEYAGEMYEKFRSPMQHCLGLALGRPHKQENRPRVDWGRRLEVSRERRSWSEEELRAIETAESWPAGLARPTLQDDGTSYTLWVEAFYVGTRRLIEAILEDGTAMQGAEDLLRARFRPPTWAGDTVRESGITTMAVSSTTSTIRGDKI